KCGLSIPGTGISAHAASHRGLEPERSWVFSSAQTKKITEQKKKFLGRNDFAAQPQTNSQIPFLRRIFRPQNPPSRQGRSASTGIARGQVHIALGGPPNTKLQSEMTENGNEAPNEMQMVLARLGHGIEPVWAGRM